MEQIYEEWKVLKRDHSLIAHRLSNINISDKTERERTNYKKK